VLLGLTGLAAVALVMPVVWLTAWKVALAVMAVLAPTLAAARAARAVGRGVVEGEFVRWFRLEAEEFFSPLPSRERETRPRRPDPGGGHA
jgi:hypothetical protein